MESPYIRPVAAFLFVSMLMAGTGLAATRYDPRLRFRVLRTPHFSIYYHQGEDDLARRLAEIAEEVRSDLSRRLDLPAPKRTHVVLVDQTDVSNGWATPLPYDTIEITAAQPPPSSFIGNHDDWLRLVFIHEYTHTMYFDRVGGIMRAVRWTFGRAPLSFPNLFVPVWQVEGLATWAESATTGLGRLHAADVGAVIQTAERAHGPMPIDKAGGGLVSWPAGDTPYFYGAMFYEDLERRMSSAALGSLTRATASRIPFFGGPAFTRIFGEGATTLWKAAARSVDPGSASIPPGIQRLTTEGFSITGPRFAQALRPGPSSQEAVYYSVRTPHEFPAIRRVPSPGGRSTRVVTRYLGDTLSSDGEWLFYDQLEFDGAVAQYADLYAFHISSGRTIRLTHRQRLTDPDVTRDGSKLASVESGRGGKRLVVYGVNRTVEGEPELAAKAALVLDEPGCLFSTPRWSPEGTRLVIVRQCAGRLPGLAIVDGATGRMIGSSGEGGVRMVTPTWTPDGAAVVFASDRRDGRFGLYRVPIARDGNVAAGDSEPVVAMPGGAMWPDVSPDGRSVVFTSMTGGGWEVYRAPLSEPGRSDAAPTVHAESEPAAVPAAASGIAGVTPSSSVAYSPWLMLLPRSWEPVLELNGDATKLGARVAGTDVLGYHRWSARVVWPWSRPPALWTFSANRPDWQVAYTYDRWRPSLFVFASDAIDQLTVQSAGGQQVVRSDEQVREVFAGVVVPWRRVRIAQSWIAGADVSQRRLPASSGVPERMRNSLRAGWAVNCSRLYGYSISPEDGVRASATWEQVSPALGADGEATSVTIDARAYLRGVARHHVLAIRAAAGTSTGDPGARRQFSLGGSAVPIAPFDYGRHALGLLRGFDIDAMTGSALAGANLDYRFPLAWIERGIRTWPFFLHNFHAAVFADVGATGLALGSLARPAASVGAELASDLVLAYSWKVSVTAGFAWVHDSSRLDRPNRPAVFVRTGYAF